VAPDVEVRRDAEVGLAEVDESGDDRDQVGARCTNSMR
jgi:hypothetical protein